KIVSSVSDIPSNVEAIGYCTYRNHLEKEIVDFQRHFRFRTLQIWVFGSPSHGFVDGINGRQMVFCLSTQCPPIHAKDSRVNVSVLTHQLDERLQWGQTLVGPLRAVVVHIFRLGWLWAGTSGPATELANNRGSEEPERVF